MSPFDHTQSVLVVEDEGALQLLISVVLRRAGYAVQCAASSAEALAAIDDDTFDIAVVDLCLPDTRGDSVVRAIRRRSPDTRVVVTSAFARSSLAMQAAADSGDAFVEKPFRRRDLLAAVAADPLPAMP